MVACVVDASVAGVADASVVGVVGAVGVAVLALAEVEAGSEETVPTSSLTTGAFANGSDAGADAAVFCGTVT